MASNDERKRFGQQVRHFRRVRDMTQDDVAQALTARGHAVTRANVGAWERGQYAPRLRETVIALEQVLNASNELTPLLGLLLTVPHHGSRSHGAMSWPEEEAEFFDRLTRKMGDLDRNLWPRVESYVDGLLVQVGEDWAADYGMPAPVDEADLELAAGSGERTATKDPADVLPAVRKARGKQAK